MTMKPVTRIVLFSLGFLVATFASQAMTVRITPSVVSHVSLVSAEIAEDVASAETDIAVRLRNNGTAIGQTVHLLTIVRTASGQTKRFYTNLIEIGVGPGHEQVVTIPIKGADDSDNLTVKMVNPNGSDRLSVFGFPFENRERVEDRRLFAALGVPSPGSGDVTVAQGGGEACPLCEWCVSAA